MEFAEFMGQPAAGSWGTYELSSLARWRLWPEAETRSTTAGTGPGPISSGKYPARHVRAAKFAGWGVKAKVALDLLTIEPSGK
jgi:hypothetical protein